MRTDRLPHESIADEVRAELARRKIDQTAVATALGVSQAGASRRLSGVTPFTINELVIIADLLGLPIARLLPETQVTP